MYIIWAILIHPIKISNVRFVIIFHGDLLVCIQQGYVDIGRRVNMNITVICNYKVHECRYEKCHTTGQYCGWATPFVTDQNDEGHESFCVARRKIISGGGYRRTNTRMPVHLVRVK